METIFKFLFWAIVLIAAGYITLFAIGILLQILAWIVIAPLYALPVFLFFGIAGYLSVKIARKIINKI